MRKKGRGLAIRHFLHFVDYRGKLKDECIEEDTEKRLQFRTAIKSNGEQKCGGTTSRTRYCINTHTGHVAGYHTDEVRHQLSDIKITIDQNQNDSSVYRKYSISEVNYQKLKKPCKRNIWNEVGRRCDFQSSQKLGVAP